MANTGKTEVLSIMHEGVSILTFERHRYLDLKSFCKKEEGKIVLYYICLTLLWIKKTKRNVNNMDDITLLSCAPKLGFRSVLVNHGFIRKGLQYSCPFIIPTCDSVGAEGSYLPVWMIDLQVCLYSWSDDFFMKSLRQAVINYDIWEWPVSDSCF